MKVWEDKKWERLREKKDREIEKEMGEKEWERLEKYKIHREDGENNVVLSLCDNSS